MRHRPSVNCCCLALQIEIRTRYLASWATSFEVLTVDGGQVNVRRRSDGTALPVPVAFEDLRARAKSD